MRHRLALALAAVVLCAAPAFAEMTITLRDGRVITIPISRRDVASIDWGNESGPAPAVAPQAAMPQNAPALAAAAPAPAAPPANDGAAIHVGPSRALKLPSQAAKVARSGETIDIDAGAYIGDVAVWRADNLTIRGVGGRAHLEADGNAAEGKAIWVTQGRNIHVENIEFSGAKVSDNNGAGIRAEGANLMVVNCRFENDQDGILAGDDGGDMDIENSEFANNGNSSGSAHAVYVGKIHSLIVRGSYFHDNVIGHYIKSRAHTTFVLYNRLMDRADGTASYEIDLSNGGRGFIIGNVLQKGPRAENYTIVAFAMEGPTLPEQALYVVGNTLVMDRSSGVFVHSRSTGPVLVADNILAGVGVPLQGPGRLLGNLLAGPEAHPQGDSKMVRDAGFIDRRAYDYHLLPGSPAIGAGVDPGAGSGFALLPRDQPVTPVGIVSRPTQGKLDLGAYAYAPR